mgnify:CR=1 FL=1|tara:strand:- start:2469 stop:3440 length:972 start_codon:yes stop_codon:yes gene_type:complete
MLQASEINSVLIIGMAGGLARRLAELLIKTYPNIEITGLDNRNKPKNFDLPVEFKKVKYNRSNFERVFRAKNFDIVYHLGRITHADLWAKQADRADINIIGTQKVLELSRHFKIKKVVLLSTYHVYGAYPDNPLFIPETYPLRATFKYPELVDVVEMDQGATNFMWRYKDEIEVIVLRPSSILGTRIRNTMYSYLTTNFTPVPIDYRPMFQFVHEDDMTRILLVALERIPSGVYNVAPDDTISIHKAKKLLGSQTLPMPISVVQGLSKFIKPPKIPAYLLEYLKFSCIISNAELKKYLGQDFLQYSTWKTLESLLAKRTRSQA